eukprot:6875843-Prymnesium_polylepis.1
MACPVDSSFCRAQWGAGWTRPPLPPALLVTHVERPSRVERVQPASGRRGRRRPHKPGGQDLIGRGAVWLAKLQVVHAHVLAALIGAQHQRVVPRARTCHNREGCAILGRVGASLMSGTTCHGEAVPH